MATMPNWQANGTTQNDTTSLTVPWPVHQANDIAILYAETDTGTISLSTAAGFVQIGTQRTATGTSLAVFWCRATSASMTSPVLTSKSDHQVAVISTFRGCVTTGNPFSVNGGGVKSTASTTTTLPTITTTQADSLVVGILTASPDSSTPFLGAVTNANLSSITERFDFSTSDGNGGGVALFTGGRVAVGAIGTTSCTVPSSTSGYAIFDLRPVPDPPAGGGITAGYWGLRAF